VQFFLANQLSLITYSDVVEAFFLRPSRAETSHLLDRAEPRLLESRDRAETETKLITCGVFELFDAIIETEFENDVTHCTSALFYSH
jgi:hypothetical protein